MNRSLTYFFLLSIILFGLIGCFGSGTPRDKIRFYTLEYEPPKFMESIELPYVLRVERFSIDPIYNSNRIIYRDESFSRDEYFYYRWRANPADMVTQLLKRDIGRSGTVKAVLHRDSRFPPSHILEGSVDEFFELDSGNTWYAVLTISITLMKEGGSEITDRILFQHTYNSRKNCKENSPKSLAEAMSTAMAEISAKVVEDLYDRLKENMPAE